MVMRQFGLFILLILAAPAAIALDKIQASVDTNPVTVTEYFVLNVTANDELNAGKLDTSILLKDFIVGRTSVSRSTQIINFNANKETRWQILLSPKHTGKILIPAFEIDGVKSNSIELSVLSQGVKPKQSKAIFIEAQLSDDEAYVGQLITYKVRLYLGAELQRGVLSAPTLDGAQIKQLGEDKDSDEIINGRRFRVIERTYGITADLPGELTIEGASFSGDVLVNSPSRVGGMFSFNESRPMQAQADKQVILINPLPLHASAALVADLVLINDNWDESITEYQVGTPITRNITLVASNANESSIPELNLVAPDSFKLYPEKPQRQSGVRNGISVSQLTQTVAIVPTKAGEYTLPEITVPWWNPKLKRQEFAKIPARKMTIQATAIGETITPEVTFATHESSNSTSGYWPWLTLFFAIAWFTTLLAWFAQSRKSTPISTEAGSEKNQKPTPDLNEQLMRLSKACDAQDEKLVLNRLQQYFCALYQQNLTLEQIAKLSPELNRLISQLQYSVYGNTSKKANLADLFKVVKNMQKSEQNLKNVTLAKLNP